MRTRGDDHAHCAVLAHGDVDKMDVLGIGGVVRVVAQVLLGGGACGAGVDRGAVARGVEPGGIDRL